MGSISSTLKIVPLQTSCCTHNLRKTPQPLHSDGFSYPANVFTVMILTIGIFRYPSTNSLLSSQLESGPGTQTIAQQTNCCLLGINDWPCMMIYPSSSMGHLKQTPEALRAASHQPSDSCPTELPQHLGFSELRRVSAMPFMLPIAVDRTETAPTHHWGVATLSVFKTDVL